MLLFTINAKSLEIFRNILFVNRKNHYSYNESAQCENKALPKTLLQCFVAPIVVILHFINVIDKVKHDAYFFSL